MLLKSFDKQGSRNARQSGVRQLRICVVNVAHTLPCKQLSVSCVTAWHYTVKNVNASCDSLKNVYGSTYTHKVSRFVFRCIRLNRFDDFIHFFP